MADMKSAIDTLVTNVAGLTTQVGALTTVVDNVVSFEQGQAAKIAALEEELKNGSVPPATIDKILEIGNTIKSNADALSTSKDKLVKASIENTAPVV